jgi:hypothetical protein
MRIRVFPMRNPVGPAFLASRRRKFLILSNHADLIYLKAVEISLPCVNLLKL